MCPYLSSLPSSKLGGRIVLSIFFYYPEISYCFNVFNPYASQFFQKSQQKLSILECLKNFIKCYISNSQDNVNALADFLKEQFGDGQMFDQAKGVLGIKIGGDSH